jgi:hypothetical protein
MNDILIKNGQIVTADNTLQADLLISGGVIARIEPDLTHPEARVIDAGGNYVLPGGVDVHTHLNLTVGGVTVGDGFFAGTAAAAFGGTTCVVEHPGFGPAGCSLKHQVAVYQQVAAGQAVVDYGLHAVFQHIDERLLDELPDLVGLGVPSAKIYLTYDGRLNDRQILSVLNRTRRLGILAAGQKASWRLNTTPLAAPITARPKPLRASAICPRLRGMHRFTLCTCPQPWDCKLSGMPGTVDSRYMPKYVPSTFYWMIPVTKRRRTVG